MRLHIPCLIASVAFLCQFTEEFLLQISVARTPHGRADSLVTLDGSQYFALPEEEQMPVQEFFTSLCRENSGEVIYAQAQNNR